MKDKTLLQIGFDPGTSLTKVIYKIEKQERIKIWTAEPEVIRLPKKSVEQTLQQGTREIGTSNAINNSWLSYRKKDEEVFAVGYFAQQFKAEVLLSQLKYESAVPKFLAVIGAIVERENLNPLEIRVNGYILLPYGEFANRDDLAEEISQCAKNFYFRNQKIQVEIDELSIAPEGGGFVKEALARRGQEWFTKQNALCVLMIGHRNASLLTLTKGAINHKATTTNSKGFITLVDKVIDRTSGHNREQLTPRIYKAGDNLTADDQTLRSIAHSQNTERVTRATKQLAEAIQTARAEYWILLKSWLNEVFPRQLDELIISGGGAFYLKDELSEYLSWTKPKWRKLEGKVAQEILAGESEPSLDIRFADIWAMFCS